ncbi:beta-1,3-galactosyltransferase 1-like isoform X2 [Mercenaria mercenaria]|nr:beta-1,3-galactosyltransferase 1-like isoform X2 [Mercenaria mercenaria]XP_053395002.1 beta-1,3-galactosyltransferase 1-like isoform X2 [Mercenaria mercenaria]
MSAEKKKVSESDVFPRPGKGSGFLQTVSGTLVSVELLTDMRSSRARRSTRRVILKASITSVILLSIAFIITYSVILTYISSKVPLMRHHDDSSSGDKSKSGKRSKLLARPVGRLDRDRLLKLTKDVVVKWNIGDYEDIYTEKPKCHKESKIIILITSAPQNYERRKSIRETWCRPSNFNLASIPWQCVFLIGQSSVHLSNIILDNEINDYHDILLGSYVDSYRNLTIKTMHGLEWVRRTCPSDFVLKTDDDVYVNTKLLHKLTSNTPKNNTYIGLVTQSEDRLKVIRDPISKWFVSMEQYPMSHYPPYAVGMGYLLSIDLVEKFINTSKHILPFANEDAYVGVLADYANVEPFRSGRFTLSGWGLRMCNYIYLVVVHHVSAEDQYKMFDTNQEAFQMCKDDANLETFTWV